MSASPDFATTTIVRDASWLSHRYDAEHDAIHFRRTPRAEHRGATFLTDEHLTGSAASVVLRRGEAMAAAGGDQAPLHFIFHSAFCCSTLLARAFDIEGKAMGLKEPTILNDLVGCADRGMTPPQVAERLDNALALLARPFGPAEAVVVKPSNVVNPMAPAILAMRPQSHALLLHAPLRDYLNSIARKEMTGRLWVRDLLVKLLHFRLIDLGFSAEDYLRHTDLQTAAVGWLAQQALFARLIARFGPERVRSLDSDLVTSRPRDVTAALASHFRISLDAQELEAVVAGPAFTRHSKNETHFGGEDRRAEQRAADIVHGDEINKVALWAEAVAASARVPIHLDAPLLG